MECTIESTNDVNAQQETVQDQVHIPSQEEDGSSSVQPLPAAPLAVPTPVPTPSPITPAASQIPVSTSPFQQSASPNTIQHVIVGADTVNDGIHNDDSGTGGLEKGVSNDFRGGKEAWKAMVYELVVYKSNHGGDSNVRYDSSDPREHALYLWLQNQRKHYRLLHDRKPSYLNNERVRVLETLGVQWNLRGEMFWEKQFTELKEYKEEYGDTIVPRKFDKNQKLGEWVTDQRRQYKHKIQNRTTLLTDERERKLNDIGFVWSIRNRTDWNDRYQQLIKYREIHNHCVVPQLYEENRALGKWVSKQREQYRYYLLNKQTFMTPERIELLNQIGFTWSVKGCKANEIEDLEQAFHARDTAASVVAKHPSAAVAVATLHGSKSSVWLATGTSNGECVAQNEQQCNGSNI